MTNILAFGSTEGINNPGANSPRSPKKAAPPAINNRNNAYQQVNFNILLTTFWYTFHALVDSKPRHSAQTTTRQAQQSTAEQRHVALKLVEQQCELQTSAQCKCPSSLYYSQITQLKYQRRTTSEVIQQSSSRSWAGATTVFASLRCQFFVRVTLVTLSSWCGPTWQLKSLRTTIAGETEVRRSPHLSGQYCC